MHFCESVETPHTLRRSDKEDLKDCATQVQISNLYIEKTCKVGSYFFGNGTTYEDEVGKVKLTTNNATI